MSELKWWDQPAFTLGGDEPTRWGFNENVLAYIKAEDAAGELRQYQARYIPGPLQTHEYAQALAIQSGQTVLDTMLLAASRAKRRGVLNNTSRVFRFVIDEKVFHDSLWYEELPVHESREAEGVMRFQVRFLTYLAREPHISIRVVDLGRFEPSFTLLSGPEQADSVLWENPTSDEFIQGDAVMFGERSRRFEELEAMSVDIADSAIVDLYREEGTVSGNGKGEGYDPQKDPGGVGDGNNQ